LARGSRHSGDRVVVHGLTLGTWRLRTHLDNPVENLVSYVGLRQERQVMLLAVATEDSHFVAIRLETAAFQRNVVGHDQIELLALQLAAGVLEQLLALGREPDTNQA